MRRPRFSRARPLVSVVVAVDDEHAGQVTRALTSLRRQSLREFEIVVAPFGASARARQRIGRQFAVESRLRVLQATSSDRVSALNVGASAARGRFLQFTHPGDELLPHTLRSLVSSVRRTGSPLAVGRSATPRIVGAATGIPPHGAAHGVRREATTLAESPVAVTDLELGNRLFERTFWRRAKLAFRDVADPDRDLALEAFRVASTFDLLTEPGYVPSGRRDGVAIGTADDKMAELGEWLDLQRALDAQVAGLGLAEVDDWWRWATLSYRVQPFLGDVDRATEAQWRELQGYVAAVVESVSPSVWARLHAMSRLKLWLAAHDRRDQLEELVETLWFERGNLRTRIVDGRVLADAGDLEIPAGVLELTELETPLQVVVRALRPGPVLEADLLVYADLVGYVETPRISVHLAAGERTFPVEVAQGSDPQANLLIGHRYQDYSAGSARVRIDTDALAAVSDPGTVWRFVVRLDHAGVRREGGITRRELRGTAGLLGQPYLAPRPVHGAQGEMLVGFSRSREHGLVVAVRAPQSPQRPKGAPPAGIPASVFVVDQVSVEDSVVIQGSFIGPLPDSLEQVQFELRHGRVRIRGVARPLSQERVQITFPLEWDPWGLGPTPVPIGRYLFAVAVGVRRLKAVFADSLLDDFGAGGFATHYRWRLARRGLTAGVQLTPLLDDDERGPFAQAQLWSQAQRAPVDPTIVYFQAYHGSWATDSQLALHEELRRTRPDLTLYWGVAEPGARVPEGGVPVLMASRRRWEILTTAGYLCTNVELGRRFATRPGQRLLQTFHGYPSKAMGILYWESKGYSPQRIERELARTRDNWSLILTPTPEMDRHYREQYRYDGEICSTGYPRDDSLVSQDAEQQRRDTRKRLGIADHQTVVLYAPTWRDDQASTFRTAEMVLHLDVEAASQAWGPDYVVLLRGHRFHQEVPVRSAARLIDVSSYPEINHLILASDAAVLDYSSLRFDFSLTGRPMVFLVPDLAEYAGGVRGFLFPFEESTPGPLVKTTAEVVHALTDLDAQRDEYADAYDAFHARFNQHMDGRAAERVAKAWITRP